MFIAMDQQPVTDIVRHFEGLPTHELGMPRVVENVFEVTKGYSIT